MKNIIEKLRELEQKLAEEYGDFALFAIFQREEAPKNKLDIVVSAAWFGEDDKQTLKFMIDNIQSTLTREEMLMLSKVVVLHPSELFVRDIVNDIQVEHGATEFTYRDFNGMLMKHAYIVTAKPVAA
jgi:hypothetical protein